MYRQAYIIYTDDILNRGRRNDRNLRTATDKRVLAHLELEGAVFSVLLKVLECDLQTYPSVDQNTRG